MGTQGDQTRGFSSRSVVALSIAAGSLGLMGCSGSLMTQGPTPDAAWLHLSENCGIPLPHVPEEVVMVSGHSGTYITITEESDCSEVTVRIDTPDVDEHEALLSQALQAAGVTEEVPYDLIGRPSGCMETWELGEFDPDTNSTSCWFQNDSVRVWYETVPAGELLRYTVFPNP